MFVYMYKLHVLENVFYNIITLCVLFVEKGNMQKLDICGLLTAATIAITMSSLMVRYCIKSENRRGAHQEFRC